MYTFACFGVLLKSTTMKMEGIKKGIKILLCPHPMQNLHTSFFLEIFNSVVWQSACHISHAFYNISSTLSEYRMNFF